jgi:hypothetical protein
MLAGLVGTRISSSADCALSTTGEKDTIHPVPGWWICIKKQNVVSAQEEQKARLESMQRKFDEQMKVLTALRASRSMNSFLALSLFVFLIRLPRHCQPTRRSIYLMLLSKRSKSRFLAWVKDVCHVVFRCVPDNRKFKKQFAAIVYFER